MIYDRGAIKWTSLMLPEHAEKLERMVEEDQKQKRPILDPDYLTELNERLHDAVNEQSHVEIKLYKNGYFHTMMGRIQSLDLHRQAIYFNNNGSGESVWLPVGNIVDIQTMN
ncbi:hypothetical protein J416_04718 [Gracilibacillus halophilus YIM-C55.5]|uniref:YolD-like protein n=1 Tax=Gracilibacillus halophilus YIM-C55.5 TaxID=1308866 RepID=N4WM89_9BACI|nr:YolD-like family protein [Gracilibacillus halophilus]ENH97292.1 hypothetical protein J416_04718 [Gracilibacillus halophilus YIM-C55.5]